MIRLIAAIDSQHGIAKEGYQPWSIPEDEKFFTDQTKTHGGNVLIGSATYEKFKAPLKDRKNFVLTRTEQDMTGVVRVHDLAEFLEAIGDEDLWVAGGESVYQQVIDLDKADELYITHIDADFGCDQFFPEFEDKFKLVERSEHKEQNGFKYYYAKYVRRD